ncbi:hypothetical protein [Rhodanobacter lindaniclasticus]
MAGKRSNTTLVSEKVSLRKGRITAGAKRRDDLQAMDIGGIREELNNLVIKGPAVPKPPAPPVTIKKVTKSTQG